MRIREASFALRVVQRRAGKAAVVYRRRLTKSGEERLDRIAAISPLQLSAGAGLLRAAVRGAGDGKARLAEGPYHPLDPDWGARVACYALLVRGLRSADRMHNAADNMRRADGAEAAWWFGLLTGAKARRATRALRIMVEAVK